MSAGDLAAVLVAILSLIAVGVAVYAVVAMRQMARRLDEALSVLELEVAPAATELVATANRLAAEADRADGLLDSVEAISARADVVSKATYRVIADPVIKTASVIRGTSRATRRLRRRDERAAS